MCFREYVENDSFLEWIILQIWQNIQKTLNVWWTLQQNRKRDSTKNVCYFSIWKECDQNKENWKAVVQNIGFEIQVNLVSVLKDQPAESNFKWHFLAK